MKVTAALAWWNESPRDLVACINGIANIADRLVTVDGAYARYPGATVRSPGVQVAAITRAAKACGLELLTIAPDRLWAGQVEKRTRLLQEAAKGSDWIVVVDADHIVHTDRDAARRALEQVPEDVLGVAVTFWTPIPEDKTLAEVAATNWHVGVAGRRIVQNQIIRAIPDLHVVDKHWIYQGTYKGQPVEVKYGGPPLYVLPVEYEVEHRTLFRSEEQMRASRAFLNDRMKVVEMTGQEDDREDLPRPEFDYETIPYPKPQPKVEPDLSVAAPTWSMELPNRVPTIGNAARGLEKGFPVAYRIRGDYKPFWPQPADEGDTVIYRFRGNVELGRYLGPSADGRHRVMHHRGPVTVSTVYGRYRP